MSSGRYTLNDAGSTARQLSRISAIFFKESRQIAGFTVQECHNTDNSEYDAQDNHGRQHSHSGKLAILLVNADDLQSWGQNVHEFVY